MSNLKDIVGGKEKYVISLFVVIVLIGSLLRFVNLGSKSLWYDETLTWQESRMPFARLIKTVNMWEGAPFLFPFIIGMVSRVNDSEFVLRFLPCLFGILSIVAIYLLSKDFMSPHAALISSLLIALSSEQVAKSQEVRFYSLVVLLSILVFHCYCKYLRNKQMEYLLFFSFASVVFVFTYYVFFIIFLSVNALFLLLFIQNKIKRGELRQWGFAQCIILIGVVIVWFVNLRFQSSRYVSNYADAASFLMSGFPSKDGLLGYVQFATTNTWKIFNYFFADSNKIALLMFFLFCVGFVALTRDKNRAMIAHLFIIVAFLNILLAIFNKYPYIPLRHCIYLCPFYYVIVAAGCDYAFLSGAKATFNKILFLVVLFLIVFTGMSNIKNHLTSPGPTEARELIYYLNKNLNPDERVYLYAAATYGFPYYYRGDPAVLRFGRVWDNSEQEAMLIAHEISYLLRDASRGWVVSMMQDRIALTLAVLSKTWNIDAVITNERKDVSLYRISKK